MMIGLAAAGLSLIMMAAWFFARRIDNYGIVDVVWSFCFTIVAIYLAVFGDGTSLRKTLILTMVGVWSARLGFFLCKRVWSHHPEEDSRYRQLRLEYKDRAGLRFFLFFQMQAASVLVLILPFFFVSNDESTALSLLECVGFAFWLISLVGEATADHQMSRFKSNPKNKGKTCREGLWKFSRHPNYFFEICIWVSFYIFALGSGLWWAFYAPLAMCLLITKVSGVPPSEAQALASRGDEFREYQRTTSVLIPWFPRKDEK